MEIEIRAKFNLGNIVATPAALRALTAAAQQPEEFLSRHALGDWGEVGEEDEKANDLGVTSGDRLLSAYRTNKNEILWIITESDRSSTTLVLPTEY